jgi:hypothetical protein
MSATIILFPDAATRHRIATARVGADLVLDAGDCEWYAQADEILDRIEAMLDAGRTREVRRLCEQAVWCLLDAAPEIDDDDAVMALVERLGDLHRRTVPIGLGHPSRPPAG